MDKELKDEGVDVTHLVNDEEILGEARIQLQNKNNLVRKI
jgi:hypothetical protein